MQVFHNLIGRCQLMRDWIDQLKFRARVALMCTATIWMRSAR